MKFKTNQQEHTRISRTRSLGGLLFLGGLLAGCESGISPAVIQLIPADPYHHSELKVVIINDSITSKGAPIEKAGGEYQYRWLTDGIPEGFNTEKVPSVDVEGTDTLKDGQVWTVEVTPILNGVPGPVSSAAVTINTRPTVTVVLMQNGVEISEANPGSANEDLKATVFDSSGQLTDCGTIADVDDGDSSTCTIEWTYREAGGTDEPWAPTTSDDFSVPRHLIDIGDTWTATVTAWTELGEGLDEGEIVWHEAMDDWTFDSLLPTVDEGPTVMADEDGDGIGETPEITAGDPVYCEYTLLDPNDFVNSPNLEGIVEWHVIEASTGNDLPKGEDQPLKDEFVKTDKVYCTVTAYDPTAPDELGVPVDSPHVEVINAPPTLTMIGINPDTPNGGDDLVCENTTFDEDAGDTVTVTYEWTIDGNANSTTVKTLLSGQTNVGNQILCNATPVDNDPTPASGNMEPSDTVTVINGIPEAQNVRIENTTDMDNDGDILTAVREDTLSCEYDYYDPDGINEDPNKREFSWTINSQATSYNNQMLAEGFIGGDLVECTVTTHDGTVSGDPASASITITNKTPELTSAPIIPDPPLTDSVLAVDYTATDDEEDSITFGQLDWYVNGFLEQSLSDGETLDGSHFSKGDEVEARFTLTDETSETIEYSREVTIQNSAPSITDLSISPINPVAGDTLSCSYTQSDADQDPDESTIKWKVNNTEIPNETSATLTGNFSGGDSVKCVVTPNDGSGENFPNESVSVTIGNTAPSIDSVSISPEPAYVTDTLECSYSGFSDVDGDADASTYKWQIKGATSGSSSSLTGGFVKGDEVICKVTPSDGTDTGTKVNASLVISNTAPVASGVSIAPSSPTVSDTLDCSYSFFDADGDADATTIEWTDDSGTSLGSGASLSGAFSSGDTITCTVTPTDDEESGTSEGVSVTIGNSAPSVSDVSISPTSPLDNDTLTCSWTFADDDEDADASTVEWTDGSGSSLGTGTTLSSGFVAGDDITCTVTANDGVDTGNNASDTVNIGDSNTAPTVSNVTILATTDEDGDGDSTTAIALDTLECSWGFSDDQGDADNSTAEWFNGSTPQGTGTTLSGVFAKGDTITCTVTPSDGTLAGTPMGSDLLIGNALPTVIGPVSLGPDPIYVDSDPTCTASFVDGDGDTNQSLVSWEVNGVEVERYTKVASGDRHSCALTTAGSIECWGVNSGDVSNDYDHGQVTDAPTGSGYIDLDSGSYHSCALSAAGEIECWGANGTKEGISTYGQVTDAPTGSNYTIIYAWGLSSCAVDTSQNLTCWGYDAHNQITDAPSTLTTGTILALGVYFGCTLDDTGLIDCWGYDAYSQVTNAPTGTGYTNLAAGTHHACALSDLGEITCWGYDSHNQVTDTPTDSGYLSVWAHGYTGCAAKSDGLLTCWGRDDHNQVTNTPTGAGYSRLTGEWQHTCALTPTGDLDCWGIDDGSADDYGQVTDAPEGLNFTAGDTIQCFIEAYDGIDVGNTEASALLTVDNSDPVVTNLSISPSPATKADTLTCSYDFFDADGDSDASEVYWSVKVDPFGTGNTVFPASTTLDPSEFNRGDMVTCFLHPTDSAGMVAAEVSLMVTIENAAPSAEINLTPSAPEAGDTLTCDYTATDADGDSFSEGYTWLINGEEPKPVVAIDANYGTGALIDVTGAPHFWGKTPSITFSTSNPLRDLAISQGASSVAAEKACAIDTSGALHCSGDTPPGGSYTQVDAGDNYYWALATDGSVAYWSSSSYLSGSSIELPDDGPYSDIGVGHEYGCAVRVTGEIECVTHDSFTETYGQLADVPTDADYIEVDASRYNACAIKGSGGISCWGKVDLWSGAPSTGSFSEIAVGGTSATASACAIDDTNLVQCWGNDTNITSNVPTDAVVALELDDVRNLACALTEDGVVICWGDDTDGQVADAPQIYSVVTAGMRHTCALTTAGSIECWGVTTGDSSDYDNDHGQVSAAPTGSDYIELDSGGYHNCALTAAGLIDCWGANGNYDASATYGQVVDAPTGSGYTAVYAWGYSSCAIDDSENLTCWGRDDFNEVTDAPTTISADTTLAFGFSHGCTLDDSGAVECWGHDANGQVNNAPTDSGYTALTSGRYHSCVLNAAGEITCWGYDSEGQVSTTPTDSGYLSLSSHGLNNCAAKSDGLLNCWGDDSYGAVTDAPTESGYTGLSGHWFHTCALTAANEIECWGIDDGSTNDYGQVTNTPDPLPLSPLGNTLSVGFEVGDTISCEISLDDGNGGSVVQTESTDILNSPPTVSNVTISPDPAYADSSLDCDYDYDDGNGDLDQSTVSWEVNGAPAYYTKVTSGGYHSCALSSTGHIDCWGTDSGDVANDYDHGQVTDAPTGSGYVDLDSGSYHSCALTVAGEIECWGSNGDSGGSITYGQVADAPTGSGYTAVYAGGYVSCTVDASQTLTCWGKDTNNEITDAPTSLPTDTTLVWGSTHGCILDNTGLIDCWGSDAYGQLSSAPTGSDYTTLSSGLLQTCGLNTSGEISCWGYDDYDQVTNTPTDSGYISLWAFGYNACAAKADGLLSCWGRDTYNAVTNTPTGAGYTGLDGGWYYGCAISSNGTLECWGVDGGSNRDKGQVTDAPTVHAVYGDTVNCTVDAFDGADTGNSATSSTITISNTTPVVTNVAISPNPATVADPLTCTYDYSDIDGQTDQSSIEWQVNSSPAGTGATLSSGYTSGDVVSCGVTPFDGVDSGASNSDTITITNSPPTVTNVSITPDPPTQSGAITCDYTLDDADGDTTSASIDWSVNGAELPSFLQVSAGDEHACALAPSGEVLCWGRANYTGQPTEAFVDISASLHHSCGVKTDGEIECWGFNGSGETVAPPGSFVDVATGDDHTCAVETSGAIQCWGYAAAGNTTPPAGSFQSVSAGFQHSCAIATDGTIDCWGSNTYGQSGAPAGSYTSLSAGYNHTCAVQDNMEVRCWGYNFQEQTTSPTGSFTSVSAGYDHSCALATDGSLDCWGDDSYGQATPPTNASGFIAVNAGKYLSCALTTEGETLCWGQDSWGQVSFAPEYYSDLTAGNFSSCALDTDGNISCWGLITSAPPTGAYAKLAVGNGYACAIRTSDGAIDCWGNPFNDEMNAPTGAFIDLAISKQIYACAISAIDGSITCWGYNLDGTNQTAYGQLNPPPGSFASVDVGQDWGCSLTTSGTLDCWGDNQWGQVSSPPSGSYTDFVAAQYTGCVLDTAGAITCWGYDGGYSLTTDAPTTDGFTQLSASHANFCALDAQGYADCWGSNSYGEATPPNIAFQDIDVGEDHSCGLDLHNQVHCWGIDSGTGTDSGQVTGAPAQIPLLTDTLVGGFGPADAVECSVTPTDGTDVGTADTATATVNTPSDGSLTGIRPDNGFVGDPITSAADAFCDASFSDPDVDEDAVTVSYAWSVNGITQGGDSATLASSNFAAGETLVCTAIFDDGHESVLDTASIVVSNAPPTVASSDIIPDPPTQSGSITCDYTLDDADGDTTSASIDWTVNGAELGAFVQISAGAGADACALTASGEAICWGTDTYGETTPPPGELFASVKVGTNYTVGLDTSGEIQCWGATGVGGSRCDQIISDGPYIDVAPGSDHTCALDSSGNAVCWNYANGYGQATPNNSNAPYVKIIAGAINTCALNELGEATCWGHSDSGAPSEDNSGAPYIDITAGDDHNCAISASGEAVCWGNNANGETNVPTTSTAQYTAIAAGVQHTCALTTDNTIECWGADSEGQSSPPQANYMAVSAGNDYTCGLTTNGDSVCWGADDQGQVSGAPKSFAIISTLNDHTCALDIFGQITCWGADNYDQVSETPSGSNWVELASGYDEACAIDDQGQILCWGRDDTGMATFPTVSTYSGLVSGAHHACVLDPVGAIECWGNEAGTNFVVSNHPTGTGYQSLGSGHEHTCAINAAGGLECWGLDGKGQVGDTPTTGTYVEVAGGYDHTCALDDGGFITCWGWDDDGQSTGFPTDGGHIAIRTEVHTSCALDASGSLICWGQQATTYEPLVPANKVYVDLAIGSFHICTMDIRGSINCWGADDQNQVSDTPMALPELTETLFTGFGPGDTVECSVTPTDGTDAGASDITTATVNTPSDGIISWIMPATGFSGDPITAAADAFCLAAFSDPDVDGDAVTVSYAWSVNGITQGSDSPTLASSNFAAGETLVCTATFDDGHESVLDSASVIVQNATPTVTSVGIIPDPPTANDALTCDYTLDDADGDATSAEVQWIVNGVDVSGFVKVRTHLWVSCALDLSGEITCWGDTGSSAIENTLAGSFRDFSIGDYANDPFICALPTTADSGVVCWGNDDQQQVGNAPFTGDYVQIDAGYGVACGRSEDGSVTCWGFNPASVTYPRVGPYTDVTAGNYSNCGILADGDLECWGSDNAGVITSAPTAGPYIDVNLDDQYPCVLDAMGEIACWGNFGSNLTNSGEDPPAGPFVGFHHGYSNGCAWDSSGALTCWGDSYYGVNTPPSVDLHSVNLGYSHACGLDDVGMPVCWGSDDEGEVTAAPTVLETISADDRTTCAVNGESRVTCWGWEDGYDLLTDAPSGEGWVSTSMGRDNACAIDDQGQITCWGRASMNSGVPTGSGFFSLSVGGFSSCALDASGAPYCWGADSANEVSHAPTAGGFQAVAAGNKFMCAIDAVGALTCWGEDDYGQATPPAGAYTQVAGGNRHGCALDTGGYITCWGVTSGLSQQADYNQVTDAPTDGGYVHIAANYYDSCAIDGNGAVSCWGEWATEYEAAFLPGVVYVELVMGASHICGLDEQGSVTCWENTSEADGEPVPLPTGGDSLVGGFGAGDTVECEVTPTDGSNTGTVATGIGTINTPPTATNLDLGSLYASTTSVTCAYDYTDADSDSESGTTFSWSKNGALEGSTSVTWSGSLVIGDTLMCTVTPHDGVEAGSPATISGTVANEPPTISGITLIPDPPATDEALTCSATVDDNDGDPTSSSYDWFVDSVSVEGLFNPSLGNEHGCVLNASGMVICWGADSDGQSSNAPMDDGYVQVLAAGDTSCAVHHTGSLTCWGSNGQKQVEDAPTGSNIVSVHSIGGHTLCALTDTGTVECWGEDAESVVTNAPTSSDFVSLSVGYTAGCAINTSGSMSCWGNGGPSSWIAPPPTSNDIARVQFAGNGETLGCALHTDGSLDCFGNNSSDPGLTPPTGIYTDFDLFTYGGGCALATDGSIDCWGNDPNGQVSSAPAGAGFVDLYSGDDWGCALDGSGVITCWGNDLDGVISNAPTESSFSSLSAGDLSICATDPYGAQICWGRASLSPIPQAWLDVDAGPNHSCAVSDVGYVQCWGWDNYQTSSDAPNEAGYIQVANGVNHSCAVDALGYVKCWGDNSYNQVSNTPTDAGYTQVAAGLVVNCALDTAGGISCWGSDSGYGVVSSPPTGTGYTQVGAGEYTACALDGTGQIECWGSDNHGITTDLPTGTGYTHLALGQADACALDAAGQISCWGNTISVETDAPTGSGYVDVDTYFYHACALDSSGEISCWGQCSNDICNPPTDDGYTALGVGLYYACAVDSMGEVACWGNDTYGEVSDAPMTMPPLTDTLVMGFNAGESVECMVSATDGSDTATDTASVTVNTPPSASAVSIDYSGSVLTVDETPSCSYTFDDFDFDPDNSTIQWAINGTLANTGSTLTDVFFSGDGLSCTVTPNDGLEDGQPVSTSETVVNALPSASGVTISPTNPTPGDAPSCDWTYLDGDGDPEQETTVEWLVNGAVVQSDVVDTGPVTGSSVSFQTGDQITCTVTPSDGVDTGVPVSEHVGTCGGNCDPVVTNVSISPTPVTAAVSAINCLYDFFDADNDADASIIYWYVNGSPAYAGASYSGPWATGDTVMCQVLPSDGGTPGSPIEETITVLNAPPTLSNFALNPSSPTTADAIQASGTTFDADNDSVSVVYEWYVDDLLNLETGPTLAATEFTKGQTVYAVGTPDDGTDPGIPVTSDTLTVLNSEPVLGSLSLTVFNNTYVCSYDYTDADSDGDASTVTWLVNGTPVSPDTYTELALGANFTCGTDATDDSIRCFGDNSVGQISPGQPTATSLTAGDQSACGLDTDDIAFCWGDDSSGQVSASPTSPVDELGLGNAHGCSRLAINVSCWGDDTYSQVADTPTGFFSELSVGADYNCVVDGSGSLSCWGRDVAGETIPPTSDTYSDLALSGDFACALDSSGAVICWGSNANGGLGAPGGVHDQLAAGSNHACALDTSGYLSCWGDNTVGQTQVPSGTFSYLGSGPSADHGCALTMSGELQCWGDDSSNQAPRGGTLSSGFTSGDTVTCELTLSDGEWSDAPQSASDIVP
jgi:alpha-tubulin suppressor-like RCC1 family protein